MAREILFRGFSKELNQWVQGDLCTGLGVAKHIMPECYCGEAIAPEYKKVMFGGWIKVESESVGQFTGKTDKNDVKIFEGDCGHLKGGKTLMVVEWTEQGCYKVQSPKNKMHGLLFCDFESNEFEIIGNVFENPELTGAQNAKTTSRT